MIPLNDLKLDYSNQQACTCCPPPLLEFCSARVLALVKLATIDGAGLGLNCAFVIMMLEEPSFEIEDNIGIE